MNSGSGWQALADQLVRLLRLGVVQLLGLARQRVSEEEDDQDEGDDDGDEPGTDREPGTARGGGGETLGH